jgi:hypothetical protein
MGDHLLGQRKVFLPPAVEICSDRERALHGGQKAELERHAAAVEIRHVRHPGHHDVRGIGVGETLLYGEPIERLGIVGGPDLLGASQDARSILPPPPEQDSISSFGCFLRSRSSPPKCSRTERLPEKPGPH